MEKIRISIAMATYNGEKFLKEQLDSILEQLGPRDEIIISDDGSTDGTLRIAESYKDKRIKILNGPRKGIKQNFANAVAHCNGKYIFLVDQDDVWLENKVDTVLKTFEETKCLLIIHDCEIFDSGTNKTVCESFFEQRKSGSGYFKNLWKNTYIGCCMAFNAELKNKILPIPNDIKMHDQWIGIIAEKEGKVIFLPKVLLRYRRHDNNVTNMHHGKLSDMIGERAHLIKRLKERYV